MNNEKIKITLPIKKAYYTTLINSLIPIHFYRDQSITIDSLKNLLFPPSVSDEEFNNLVNFIKFTFDEIIKNNKDKNILEKELNKTYNFNVEEVLNPIFLNVTNKSEEILNFLNSKFDMDQYNLKNLEWTIKTILLAKSEDYMDSRYTDIEFNMTKSNKSKNCLNDVKNVSISFTKKDLTKAFMEFKRIKENLKLINFSFEKLNNDNNENIN